MNLSDIYNKYIKLGYSPGDARARVCQDVILKAISESELSKRVTIKGGVVMRSITNDTRRATQDMDIDFIKYSLSDESIDSFIKSINCLDEFIIKRIGTIEELKQQDYKGKRIFVDISDQSGRTFNSKIDFGVHKHLEITQKEYCFDIAFDDEGASLLINTQEQMFTEKLRSLLKFGYLSTRYKDIYDMYYQCGKLDEEKLAENIKILILADKGMKENSKAEIVRRLKDTFSDKEFTEKTNTSNKRWLDDDINVIFTTIIEYIQNLNI